MRVAVIGAGVAGVACAFELSSDGHAVTVFERRGSVAVESSFAPSGLTGPGPLTSSAWPGTRASLRQLRPHLDAATLRWAWRWHRAPIAAEQQVQLLQLAHYSRQRQQTLIRHLQLELDQTQGHLLLQRSRKDADRMAEGLAWLAQAGIAHRKLDAAECLALEPGLNPHAELYGGIHLPEDTAGNCRQFTLMLRSAAEHRGTQFRFHHAVNAVLPGGKLRLAVTPAPAGDTTMHTAADSARDHASPDAPYHEEFDAVVMCAAMGAPALLATLGQRLPLMPLWGQSITAPLRHLESHPGLGPRSAVTDVRTGVTFTRIDTRLRVAGGTRLAPTSPSSAAALWPEVQQTLDTWYPGVTRASHAQRWVGARPTLPDGLPVLGASPVRGVWLNLGHSHAGWALACGTARALADQIAGRAPSTAVDHLNAARFLG